VFDVDLAGSNLVVECRSRTGTGQQARQLDSTPLRFWSTVFLSPTACQ